ncbi:MAG: hypothetical protein LBH48_05975 [Bifidobacteriaceae bacterium]|nr:hypothetical protein [Bifidobacteriaceae bacterium]
MLLVLAVVLVGPGRLPGYAKQLGRFVRTARDTVNRTKDKVEDELGVRRGAINWDALDPRQYDPRKIVRNALDDAVPEGLGLKSPGRLAGSGLGPAPSAPLNPERQPNSNPVQPTDGQS